MSGRGWHLFDAHVHLDFMRSPRAVAAKAAALGLGLACCTVTPGGYERLSNELGRAERAESTVCGLGLHPWWAAKAGEEALEAHLAAFERARPGAFFVGEIGLDASPKHVPGDSLPRQRRTLERICALCAEASSASCPLALSIHAVGCASQVLDVLEATGCSERCRCILHWFSGSSDELWRAVRLGCRFSFGERSLSTRRGREYVRILPGELLLTETDQPPGEDVPWQAEEIAVSLEATLGRMGEIRGEDCRALIARNAEELFGNAAG